MNDHKYLSTTNLKNSIEEISKLRFKLLLQNGVVTKIFEESFKGLSIDEEIKNCSKEDIATILDFKNKYKSNLDDQNTEQEINSMCFIRLYSSFEAFMSNLLIDLYYMFPESIPDNRKISVESILLWNNTKSVKEYVIDSVAIDNSYTLEIWKKTLKTPFGIEFMRAPKNIERLEFFDLVRNLTLHSDGRVNSKFLTKAPKSITKKHLKDGVFERVELSVDYYECFNGLQIMLESMIDTIENKYKFTKKNLK